MNGSLTVPNLSLSQQFLVGFHVAHSDSLNAFHYVDWSPWFHLLDYRVAKYSLSQEKNSLKHESIDGELGTMLHHV